MTGVDKDRYALITGATSGIGYELAKLFAQDGYNLIIVARTEEDLQQRTTGFKEQYLIDVVPIAKDLFQKEAAFELYEEIKKKDYKPRSVSSLQVNCIMRSLGKKNIMH